MTSTQLTPTPPIISNQSTAEATGGTPCIEACKDLVRLPSADALDRLAHAVTSDGIEAHEDAIGGLLAAAVSHGVSDLLIAIVADTSNAPIMRERALGHLLSASRSGHVTVPPRSGE